MIKSWYYNQYPDVQNSKIPPITHWVNYGRREGRYISPPIWFLIYTYKLRKSILDGSNMMAKYDNGANKNSLYKLTRNTYAIKINRSNYRRNRKFLKKYLNLIRREDSLEIYFKLAKNRRSQIRCTIKRNRIHIYIPRNCKTQQHDVEFIQHILNTNLKCKTSYDRKLMPLNLNYYEFDKLDNLNKFKTYIENAG